MRFTSMTFAGCALGASWLAIACGSSGNSPALQSNDAGVEETSVAEETGTPVKDSGSPAVDAPVEAAGSPAFIPTDVPQVENQGGPVMTAPKVVPIFYAADDATTVASIKDFVSKLPHSSYWMGFTSEYGVGDVTAEAPIVLTDTLPQYWDDSQIQAFLAAKLNAGDPAFPAPDANTIYAFFFPPNVTITTLGTPDSDAGDAAAPPASATSCTGFGGYHDNITLANNMDVAYAVVPRCATFGPLGGIDAITGPASHELAEAATDPFPSTNPAFLTVDAPHSYWTRLLGGGEVGDMCAQEDSSFVKFPPDVPYVVQRIWSNKAALAGTDSCMPTPAGNVYFNTYPVMPDMITYSSRGVTTTSKGIEIAVGASRVVEFDLASTAPTSGPWTVKIIDSSSTGDTYLSAAFMECGGAATCSGENGVKLHATITVVSAGRRGTEPFLIESTLPSGVYALWAGLVGTPTEGGAPPPMDAGGGG
jgi:hypothetical protein